MATMDRIRAIEARLDSLATKQDLADLSAELRAEIQKLRAEMREDTVKILDAISHQGSASY